MRRPAARGHLTARLFAVYAVLSAIPILALGFILAANFRGEARQRGLMQGREEAALIAHTAIQPLLDGRPLSEGIDSAERPGLNLLASQADDPQLLRLRLRGLDGRAVFSIDGTGRPAPVNPDALHAARGHVIAELTHLNADDDAPTLGPRVVQVYLPLEAGIPRRRVGVLEAYLPYAPIAHDVSHLLATLYRDLVMGLGALYLVLFAITASVSGRLSSEGRRNAFLADNDTLTALPNRASFQRRAADAIADARRTGTPAAVAIIDLDRFKTINDTLGHRNGDTVLSALARRLRDEFDGSAFVARFGGDEFGVVLADGTQAAPTLWRLRKALDREVPVAGLTLAVQASIGYALAPDDGDDVDTLLQRADMAMYAAKDQHTGVARFEPSLDHYDAASLSLVAELRHAIDDGQLVLHYQPQQELRSGRVIALEALVRWQHPVQGLLFPDRFLPLAEQTDDIDRLTRWVLRRALTDLRSLSPERGGPRIAVNVSARSLGRGELASEVLATLAELSMDPDRLIVEVTETAILADPERAADELRRLASAGVKVSLDDFGKGQTSVGHLSELPLHELKIDRAFVGDMDSDPAHAAIVRSMVELGHSLGLQVVAEGVETEEVSEQLREVGTDLVQGYLLSRPLPLDQIVVWLTERRRAARLTA